MLKVLTDFLTHAECTDCFCESHIKLDEIRGKGLDEMRIQVVTSETLEES